MRTVVPVAAPVRTTSTLSTSSADQSSLEMRVAVDRAADRARRAGPCLEPRDAAVDRPSNQAVDRQSAVRADECRRRRRATSPPCTRITTPRTPASATSTLDPPPRTVTGRPAARGSVERGPDLARALREDQPVRRTADLEGGERRERRVALHALGRHQARQPGIQITITGAHGRPPARSASRARNAARASACVTG